MQGQAGLCGRRLGATADFLWAGMDLKMEQYKKGEAFVRAAGEVLLWVAFVVAVMRVMLWILGRAWG